jgi:hypothetical protein
MAETTGNSTVQRVVAELSRDKKKTIILSVLLLVGAIMGARLLLSGGGPAKASASPMVTVNGSPTTTVKASPDPTNREAKAKARRDQYIKEMDGSITRDLFAADITLFPVKHVEPVKVMPTTTSAPSTAREDEQRRTIQVEAQALVLESTMLGDSSIASINGKILRVGDNLGGFQVLEITSRSCVVRKKSVTVVLEIRK